MCLDMVDFWPRSDICDSDKDGGAKVRIGRLGLLWSLNASDLGMFCKLLSLKGGSWQV